MKHPAFSAPWELHFFSSITSEGGVKSTRWHLKFIANQTPTLSRADLLEWIALDPRYNLIRLRLALKITKQTTGFTPNDTRFFARRIWRLLPPGERPAQPTTIPRRLR